MDVLTRKKLGNTEQIISAHEVIIEGANRRCILAENHKMQLLISKDNCLDILWLKFAGINISFLSVNGINGGGRDFDASFEGGFLYTCGLENIGRLNPGKMVHGSIHHTRAQNVNVKIEDEKIIVSGKIKDTMLFDRNVVLERNIEIGKDFLRISDNIINEGFTDSEYLLLYHFNFGYPFLDTCLGIEHHSQSCEGLSQKAKANESDAWKIAEPQDGCAEEVFYHRMSKGEIGLCNKGVGVRINMAYDTAKLPYLIEWKSMQSGAYALGIEPSVSRFDALTPVALKGGESKAYRIDFRFSQI